MKKINYFLATSAAALLLASAPMLASASAHEGASINASAKSEVHSHAGLGMIASLFNHSGRDNDNDMDDVQEHMGSSTASTTKHMHATVGVVTAINGSTFTISPVGHKATTTVSTDSATAFRADGQATSSGALQVGSHVALIGTSTSDTSIAASMVSIFTKGFGFFKHFLHFGLR